MTILIVGAGIAGLSLGIALQRNKIPFKIIEKRNGLETTGTGIALPANATQALHYLGMEEDISALAHRVKRIIYADSSGTILAQGSLLEPPLDVSPFVALTRAKFHSILSSRLQNASIDFNTTIKSLRDEGDKVFVRFNTNETEQKFSAVVGADGAHSSIRSLVFPETKLDDLGVNIFRWVCAFEHNDLQPIYMLGTQGLFMAYPIGKNEVYCYAHVFSEVKINPDSSKEFLQSNFRDFGGVAKTLLEQLDEFIDVVPSRLHSLSEPIFFKGNVALIGDASHACSPTLQQGAAAALEDAIILSNLLAVFPIQKAFIAYEQFRKERLVFTINASNGPMKGGILDDETLSKMIEKIQANGPFNILGWRKLLSSKPIDELEQFIQEASSLYTID